MPRAAPNTVYEHRLTLGTYERAKLESIEKTANIVRYTAVGSVVVAGLGVASFGYLAYTAAQWLGTGSIFGDIKDRYNAFRETDIDVPTSAALTAAGLVNPNAVEEIQARLEDAESKRVQSINAINEFYDRAIQTHLDVLNQGGLTSEQEAYQRRKIVELDQTRQQRIKQTNDYFTQYQVRVNSASATATNVFNVNPFIQQLRRWGIL